MITWDAKYMYDGTGQPIRLHVPATRMRSFPVKGLYIGLVAIILGGLLIGFGIGYTIGHDREAEACGRAYRSLFVPGEPTPQQEQQYREDKIACLRQ